MASMDSYSKAAMERAMKVQEVILRAMAKKITWWQAAEIIGISDRQMRRWRERYEEFGYDGLFDRRRGQPSPKRVSLAVVEQVLGLYRERYFDLNVQHFHEKLQAEHGIQLSYTWVKAALQGAGLVARGRKRGVHRRRRERRPLPGMLLPIDGSRHRWFQDERWYDLIVILDDATSEIYYAQLVEEESTATVMAGLREVIERKGLFCALYSDRGSHFWHTPKAGGKVEAERLTQVGRLNEVLDRLLDARRPLAAFITVPFALRETTPISKPPARHSPRPAGQPIQLCCCRYSSSGEETRPSFFVNTRKDVFYCHGCGEGGDLLRFLQLWAKAAPRRAPIKYLPWKPTCEARCAGRFGLPIFLPANIQVTAPQTMNAYLFVRQERTERTSSASGCQSENGTSGREWAHLRAAVARSRFISTSSSP